MRFLMAFLFLLATGCFDSRPSQPGYYPSYGPARQTYVYPAPYPPHYVEPDSQDWPHDPHYVEPEPQEWSNNGPRYAGPHPNDEYHAEHRAEQQEQHHEQQEMHQEQQERNRAEQRERHQNNQHNGQPDND